MCVRLCDRGSASALLYKPPSLDFGDWTRLTFWQRVKRRFSLLRGSYIHPDGTVELASENRS